MRAETGPPTPDQTSSTEDAIDEALASAARSEELVVDSDGTVPVALATATPHGS